MLRAILCADWSREPARRAAYVADVPARVVKRVGHGPFGLQALLNAAAAYEGEVLVGIDAPFGAPRSLLAATYKDLGVSPTATFTEWVRRAAAHPDFLRRAIEGEPWSPLRPFFRVPAGTGARNLKFDAMRACGVDPFRACDTRTAAKSLFILSGIPGSVGSSVVDLWPSLTGILANHPGTVRVWPFGQPEPESGTPGVVLAEIYPRALYAIALSPEPPATRARMSLAKSDRESRKAAVERLKTQPWVREHGVTFEDAEPDILTEDSFDALVSAAALLRCVLEGTALGWSGADTFEGGILALDSLNLDLPEQSLRRRSRPVRRGRTAYTTRQRRK